LFSSSILSKTFIMPSTIALLFCALTLVVSPTFAATSYSRASAFKIPPGTLITLTKPLSVSAGKSRVFIQDGKAIDRVKQTYAPYCYFAMRRPRSEMGTPTVISPDTFTVTKQYRRNEMSAKREFNLAMNSTSPPAFLYLASRDGGPLNLNYSLKITSTSQPKVSALVCGIYSDPQDRGGLSVAEIQSVLEGFASFEMRQ
jgi:hypothetical protein